MSGKEQFGTWLRFLRKKSGLKQYELAERINIDPTLISRYECGTAMPALETIQKLAEGLGVAVDELLNEPEHESWMLKIKLSTELNREEFIDMTSNNCISNLNLTPKGAALTLSADYSVFEDEAKLEDFFNQIRAARDFIIESGRKMLEFGKTAPAD